MTIRQSPILDPGVVQTDALTIDKEETWNTILGFYQKSSNFVEDESRFLIESRADCVLADAPPFPIKAARVLFSF